MKQLLFGFVAAISLAAATVNEVHAEDILLVCDSDYILLRPDAEMAALVEKDPVVVGQLTVKDNLYLMKFPKTEKTYEIHIKVNRYTRKFEWEHGTPPFFNSNARDESTPGNFYRTGECQQTDAVRRF